MKFYKDSDGLWVLGDAIVPAGTCFIETLSNGDITISFINGRNVIYNGPVTDLIKENEDAYVDIAELLTSCGDFFVNPLNPLKEDVEGLQQDVSAIQGGYLGTLLHTDAAPEPGVSGIYKFISAGVVSWLSGTPTVAVGDEVSVVFTNPTYTYTYIQNPYELLANKQNSLAVDGTGVKFPTVDAVNEMIEPVRSQSTTKAPTSKLLDDELNAVSEYIANMLLEAEIIPKKSDALFHLDGSIQIIESDYYFIDKTLNERNFLITNYDFDSDWAKGFPYKSIATISAPEGDYELIAADINNYLYALDGTPNQIPVISLFQNVDYENKLFSRHLEQQIDENGVEKSEARVVDIVLYNTVKSGNDLLQCNTYYGVPTENTLTSVWLSPSGNDTTGNGSKSNPYRTFNKIKATTKDVVYLKTGDYSFTTVTFTSANMRITGVGRCTATSSHASIGFQYNGNLFLTGLDYNGLTPNYSFYKGGTGRLYVNKCIIKQDSYIYSSSTGFEIIDSIFPVMLRLQNSGSNEIFSSNLVFNTCYFFRATNGIIISNNKIKGSVGSVKSLDLTNPNDTAATNVNVFGNTIIGYNSEPYVVYIGGTGEQGYNAINELNFTYNKVISLNNGGGVCHTCFIGGGINHKVKYNDVTVHNGYAFVIKSNGYAYTTNDAHFAYNIIRHNSVSALYSILAKGVVDVIIANNTIIGFSGLHVFGCSKDVVAAYSATFINNLVKLGGNTTSFIDGSNFTIRNNVLNKNGYTITNDVTQDDFVVTTEINENGVPASKIEYAEVISGTGNNIGLSTIYAVPKKIAHRAQAATWQNGAVLLK